MSFYDTNLVERIVVETYTFHFLFLLIWLVSVQSIEMSWKIHVFSKMRHNWINYRVISFRRWIKCSHKEATINQKEILDITFGSIWTSWGLPQQRRIRLRKICLRRWSWFLQRQPKTIWLLGSLQCSPIHCWNGSQWIKVSGF